MNNNNNNNDNNNEDYKEFEKCKNYGNGKKFVTFVQKLLPIDYSLLDLDDDY